MNELSTELIFEPQHLTKETIKKYLCPLASDQELMMGLQIAKTFNLNPLKREIYFIKYGTEPMQTVTGYEVYLKRADRSGKYKGLRSWTEGSLTDGNLKGCVEIYREGWEKPLYLEVDYSEYVQRKKDGTVNRFWATKPKTMIKKVAESQGFRKAFPDEFDGMPYTSDEVIDQEKVLDIPVQSIPTQEKAFPFEPKDINTTLDTDEDKITSEQGTALLMLLAKNLWTKEDLKEYIFFEFNIEKLSDIQNSHLLKIKEYFSVKKIIEVKQ